MGVLERASEPGILYTLSAYGMQRSAAEVTAAIVEPTDMLPPAELSTVGEAWDAIQELSDPEIGYRIAWDTTDSCHCGCGYQGIIRRFSRKIEAEAWLIATPDDGGNLIVCPILVSDPGRPGDERAVVEARLVHELSELIHRHNTGRQR